VLVGRSAERHRIESLLAAARTGSSGVLVLHGDAGIGKSALLEYAREQAGDMTLLAVSGVESEARLAFAGLTELLRPVAEELSHLPPPQADALHSALALHAEPANPLAVRVAVLTLLATLAETAPVLVTVDDAQWVDEASLEALAFAVRRLTAERVAVVASTRGEALTALRGGPSSQLLLTGLSDNEARQLLTDRAGLSGSAADRLLEVAHGNPLALLELPDVMGPAGPGTALSAPGVEPPPVGPRVQQAFRARFDLLPAPTRLALAVVAADGAAGPAEVLRAFASLGLEPDALQPAEQEGLVAVEADRIDLRHPLLRSAVYHALSAPERRRIHAALAAVLERPSELERRTWHRAAAALGPDDDVAEALDEVAQAAERRGDVQASAHGFARAAGLSVDDNARALRLLTSADAWLAAGHWELALERLDQAIVHAIDPGLRVDIAASTGQLEAYRAGPDKGEEILVAAADQIEADDPERATRLLTYAVNVAVFAGDISRAVALAERAQACGQRAGGLNAVAGTMAWVQAGLLAGDPSVPRTLEPLAQLAEQLIESDLADAEHVYSLVVLADFVLESWDRAESLLDLMVRRSRDTGRLFLLAFALAIRGELDFRRGRWADAYATVTTEVWENPLGLPGVGAWLHAVQARVEAGLGLAEEAQAHGQAALDAATATGTLAVAAWAGAALGFLDLGRERPQAAVGYLEEVAETLERGGFGEPGVLWWAADLIEALWRIGDVGMARRRLEVFQAQADATGRVWARATAARCAGLLAATPVDAEAAFAESLRWHAALGAPFERARTWLRLGERRLGFGRDDAEGPLREALASFTRLGAEPWALQAQRLLGDAVTSGEPEPVALTRQERQVAAIVGHGATNREAADQLFLSPRTIDFHLRNIYKKLQVRSRTELAVRLAAIDAEPGASVRRWPTSG
jgi:DNA-binding CsgD family transcriptional regulator/tetratricopeptide (TPR) repeat protein